MADGIGRGGIEFVEVEFGRVQKPLQRDQQLAYRWTMSP